MLRPTITAHWRREFEVAERVRHALSHVDEEEGRGGCNHRVPDHRSRECQRVFHARGIGAPPK